MFNFIKKLLGSKHDRDVKEYMPLVEKTNQFYGQYKSLSNDQLRSKTLEFKDRISKHLEGINSDLQKLHDAAMAEKDLGKKEAYFDQIDDLIKEKDI